MEYGDWNMLGGIISEEEVNKIKKDFAEDLKSAKANDSKEDNEDVVDADFEEVKEDKEKKSN